MITEKDIQKQLIQQCVEQGYSKIVSHTELSNLNATFKSEVERLNDLTTPKARLTATEFDRLLQNMSVDISTAFQLLRHGVELIRDDNSSLHVTLFDTHDYSRNHFQITEEITVTGIRSRRVDVIILMNGIPVVAIELKSPTSKTGLSEALNDLNLYTSEGVYRSGLFKFIQIYIHSDSINTRYQATTPRTEMGEPLGYGFAWSDESNIRVNQLLKHSGGDGFVQSFLNPETLTDLLWRHMFLVGAPRANILILRPYQVHAVKAGLERLTNTTHNGYFWHATGSGKTLTSYALTKAVSEEDKFSKVVMLLDRNDLATQTIEEYGAFSGNKTLSVQKSNQLLKALQDPAQQSIITTIQSFSRLMKKHEKALASLTADNICFIIDECHRSTFGEMFRSLTKTFKNAQFIGFTGTPILTENPSSTQQITSTIFGEPIHIYTIQNAIADKNVLPFELKEVEWDVTLPAGTTKNKQYYSNPSRQAKISSYITENLRKHTGQGTLLKTTDQDALGYTAMLACDSISSAYDYWAKLTPLLAAQGRTTALMFSVQDDKDLDSADNVQWYKTSLESYDKTYNTSFSPLIATEGVTEVRRKHLNDLMRRIKNREVDLMIVSDMLLTGFDAQTLNTLYLDKGLKYHNLVQAISRTNRVHSPSNKTAGNIIIFNDREMSGDLDEAITLYSNGQNADNVLKRRNYQELYNNITANVTELRNAYPTTDSVDDIHELRKLIELATLFSELNSNIKRIQTYDEWEEADWKKINITRDELAYYHSAIRNKRDDLGQATIDDGGDDDDLLAVLDYTIDTITSTTIDIAYINSLLQAAVFAPPSEKEAWKNKIRHAISITQDPEVQRRSKPILLTLEQLDTISNDDELRVKIAEQQAEALREEIFTSAERLGLNPEDFLRIYSNYQETGLSPKTTIRDKFKKLGLNFQESRTPTREALRELHRLADLY